MDWIGFLLADGSFYNESEFEFGLKESDKNVLEEFSKYIGYIGDIKHRESTNSNRIYFSNSLSIPKFMAKYGFQFNKTYNPNSFDCFRKYTREQLLSLLIGIIDGDGSISNNGSDYTNQIIITSHKVWKLFYKELFKCLEIEWHCTDKENKALSVRICKREYCLMLKRFILNNNLFYLQRKWNKIIEKPTEK